MAERFAEWDGRNRSEVVAAVHRHLIGIAVVAAMLLGVGCAALTGVNAPRVNVSNVTPQDVTLFEQKFLVQLRIQNPNDFDLEVRGMTFSLDLNGKSFATGLSNRQVTIPRFGSELVEVEMFSGTAGILRQLTGLTSRGQPKFAYRLRGKVYLEKPHSGSLAFDEEGEIELPMLNEAGK